MPGYLPGAAGFSKYVRILPDGVSRSTTVCVMVSARTGVVTRARGAAREARRLSKRRGAQAAASRLDSRPARGAAACGTAHEARVPAQACGARALATNAPDSKLTVAMLRGGGKRSRVGPPAELRSDCTRQTTPRVTCVHIRLLLRGRTPAGDSPNASESRNKRVSRSLLLSQLVRRFMQLRKRIVDSHHSSLQRLRSLSKRAIVFFLRGLPAGALAAAGDGLAAGRATVRHVRTAV